VRLNLGDGDDAKWFRISDFVPWRVNKHSKKVIEDATTGDLNGDLDIDDEVWIDDGSVADATHADWPSVWPPPAAPSSSSPTFDNTTATALPELSSSLSNHALVRWVTTSDFTRRAIESHSRFAESEANARRVSRTELEIDLLSFSIDSFLLGSRDAERRNINRNIQILSGLTFTSADDGSSDAFVEGGLDSSVRRSLTRFLVGVL
jgi:hypothetical protein